VDLMNWKEFKNKYNTDNIDESKFIIGIDIGNNTSSLSYFDFNRKSAEVIDISGGYGKAGVPTVLQYIKESKEWVFGEYAVLNKGMADETTFSDIINNLGKKAYYEIDDKPISLIQILSIFIKELLSNIKNINPNAEIVGILAAVPYYITEEAKNEFINAFKVAGFEKEFIGIITERECLLQDCYNEVSDIDSENALMIDFGSREIRGGIYNISLKDGVINAECISTYFDDTAGTENIEKDMRLLFESYYIEETGIKKIDEQTNIQLDSFMYQQKDLFFQRKNEKDFKIYFNFVYPPFQKLIKKDDINKIISPFYQKFEIFLNKLFNLSKNKIKFNNIDKVICSGGGFEMVWTREFIEDKFEKSKITFFKNPKSVISNGACIAACKKLNVIVGNEINVIDNHQLKKDIGVMIRDFNKDKFVPIIEKDSFWWKEHKRKLFIINKNIDSDFELKFYERDEKGETKIIKIINLTGLPKRPKGTTQISIELKYKNFETLTAEIKDFGFGELFPKSDYEQTFILTDNSERNR